VTRDLRKLHDKEFHNLYSSPSIIRMISSRRMRSAGHVTYRILVGKPERMKPLRKPRHRWEDNMKMNLREIGWGGMYWIHLAQDWDHWRPVVNTVMNPQVL
jgi:hypothetical protein